MLTSPFFVSVPNVLATRCGCALRSACRGASERQWRSAANRSRLPPRSVLDAPHRGAAPEPAGETSSPLHLHQAMAELPSLSLLYSELSHPASSASNRCYPLQHPERTRFRLFLAFPGAFRCFCPFLTRKIFGPVFVHCADMSHRLKPSVMPCRRALPFPT